MGKTNVLYISQEIMPYLPESHMSVVGRHLPQGIQERGNEIRTFMPRYGCINERRNQLHEVIRLSGMNLIVDDSDHPLIIKVASIQPARMQVYFIDNEEYFERKSLFSDEENGFCCDNDERIIFFCRGVLETVKKLGWTPDIIHCHGWFTSLIPLYIRTLHQDDPLFIESKIIYSVYNDSFSGLLNKEFTNKLKFDGIHNDDLNGLHRPTYFNLCKSAIDLSDAVIFGSDSIHPEVNNYVRQLDKPYLEYKSINIEEKKDDFIETYSNFYDTILEENSVLVD